MGNGKVIEVVENKASALNILSNQIYAIDASEIEDPVEGREQLGSGKKIKITDEALKVNILTKY